MPTASMPTTSTARPHASAHGGRVEFRSLRKAFGDFVAVDDIDLTIDSGEFFSLLGPSGCGKTTTLRSSPASSSTPTARSSSTVPIQWVPADWADEPHEAELDAFADRVIDGYTELAPNFKQSIVERQVIGQWQMANDNGLIGGNIFHGELSPDQLFHMRPAPGYADFTTPVDGLYQCSSATHGRGGVTGIPLLCTKRVLADARRRRVRRPIGRVLEAARGR